MNLPSEPRSLNARPLAGGLLTLMALLGPGAGPSLGLLALTLVALPLVAALAGRLAGAPRPRRSLRPVARPRWAPAALALAAALLTPAVILAHNLQTKMVGMWFDTTTLNMLDARIAGGWVPGTPLLQVGDQLGIVIKGVPRDGTNTGVGGYLDFYVPNGVTVIDAGYVVPDGTGDYDLVPMKGQSLIAIGDGPVGAHSTAALIGLTLGPNFLGTTEAAVTASGLHRGTIAGVYGDTGIFYSSSQETAWGSYGSSLTLKNNSGDVIVPLNRWDAEQLAAYGISGSNNPAYPGTPIIDPNGRGNSPWGLANGVAGPESGYAWQFDMNVCGAPGNPCNATTMKDAANDIGPWKRIQYMGSRISKDQAGLSSTTLGLASTDVSPLGLDVNPASPLPATVSQSDGSSPKTLRWSVGQTTLNSPEFAWVQVKVDTPSAAFLNPSGCPVFHGGAFGGDAGGDSNGKDHLWRYYEPSTTEWNGCVGLGKPSNRLAVKSGDTFQYKIKFYNLSAFTYSNVVVEDLLPSGVTFISAVPAQNTGPNPLRWVVGNMLPGTKFEATVTVKASGSGALENNVTVTTDQGTFTGSEITPSGSLPYLKQTKSVSATSVAPGANLQYTVLIENIGTGTTGSPVTVNEYLPTGFTFVSKDLVKINNANVTATTTVNSGNPNAPIFTVPGAINPGGALELTFTAQVGAGVTPGTYCNAYTTWQGGTPSTTGGLACVSVGGARIGDTVFRDWDGDGVQDPVDEGMPGVTVNLYAGSCPPSGGVVQTKTSDSAGQYLFTGLAAGTFCVDAPAPGAGGVPVAYSLTTANDPRQVTIVDGQQVLDVDFGYQPSGVGSIGDTVFEDVDNNGVFDGSDVGIDGVDVSLYEDSNGNGVLDVGQDALLGTATTAGGGVYDFGLLDINRSYLLLAADGAASLVDAHFVNPYVSSTGTPQKVAPADFLAQANNVTDADFGYFENQPSSIGDQAFIDSNGNGVFNPGTDSPLPGVTIELYRDGALFETAVTDVDGLYLFDNLATGNYVVKVVLDGAIPGGYGPTVGQYDIALPVSTSVLTADFPFVPLISKSVDKAQANPGETLTYQIAVRYPGSELLSNVVVTDTMPTGTQYAGGASPAPAVQPVIGGTGVISWTLGSNTPARDGSVIPAVTLLAQQDTYIDEDKPAINYGALADLTIDGNTSSTKERRMLVQFDLTSVCPGAIQSADLVLVRQDGGGNSDAQQVTVRRITQSWNAATATWNSFGAAGFASAGSDPVQTVTGNSSDVPYTWNVTDIVKSWCQIASPNPNDGFLLDSALDANKIHLFYSAEGAPGLTPKLKINGGGPEFAAPAHVTTSLGGNSSLTPATVYDGNGVAHVVYTGKVSATDSKINVYYSNDQGTGAWTAPLRINSAEPPFDANDATLPRIAVDGNNNLYVVFQTKGSTDSHVNVYALKGTKGGGNTWTWGAAADVSNDLGGNDSLTPDIIVDSLGIAHVVFAGKNAANGDSKINIYYSRDGGTGTWTAPVKRSLEPPFDANDALHPRIALGLSDSLHIAFQSKTAADSKINVYYVKGTKSGATWTFGSPVDVSNDLGGQDSLRPDIDVDSAGAAHIVFQGKSAANGDGKINIYYSHNGSGSFSSPKKVSLEPPFDANDSLLPQLTIGADDKLHVTFQGKTAFDGKINAYYTTIDNGVIGTATNVTQDLGNQDALVPDVAVSGSDALVVYRGKTGGDIDIFASTVPLGAAAGNLTNHIAASPTLVGGGQSITVIQSLSSDTADNNLVPGTLVIAGAGGAGATCGAATLLSVDDDLDGTAGDAVVYRWTCTSSVGANIGSVTFKNTASGSSLAFAEAASNSVLVTPVLSFQVTVDNPAGVGIVQNTAYIRDDTVIPGTPSNIAQTVIGASIGDFVWADLDGDGLQDPGEPGLAGVQVNVTGPGCAPCSAVTDALGAYLIGGLGAGSYTVATVPATIPVGYLPTTPASLPVTLIAGQQYQLADYGLRPPGTASIGDTVWQDENGDGLLDPGEPGIPGITVRLYIDQNNDGAVDIGDTLLFVDITDANGIYGFSGLHPDDYLVLVDGTSPVTSPYDNAVTTTLAAGMAPTTGTTNPRDVTISTVGQVIDTADFGYNWSGSIGDFAWYDNDGDGVQDGGAETGAPNVNLVLYYDVNGDGELDPGDTVVSAMETGPSGAYLFDHLPPGDYIVKAEEQQVPAPPSSPHAGQIGFMVATNGSAQPVTLAPAQDYLNADFGFLEAAEIEGHVFHDVNRNGVLDPGEPLLPGVDVTLTGTDANSNPVNLTTTTDANGEYAFVVAPGSYTIAYSDPDVLAIDPSLTDETTPISYAVNPAAGQELTGYDFGVDHAGIVGDRVWNDSDADGVQDPGEGGLAGVTVTLYQDTDNSGTVNAGDVLLAIDVTDALGEYQFAGLPNGEYVVRVSVVTLPTDFAETYDNNAPLDNTSQATVAGGGSDLNADLGYRYSPFGGASLFTISGRVYDDVDNNGNDTGEPGFNAVDVQVVCDFGTFVVPTSITGAWSLSGVPQGSTCTVLNADESDLPSAAYSATESPATPITVNADIVGLDFGYHLTTGSISGSVCDGDGDGLCEPGEVPLTPVTVTLRYAGPDGILNTMDDTVLTDITDALGDYSFPGLQPGLFQITEANPPGYNSVADADGGNPDNITIVLVLGQNKVNQDFEDNAPSVLATGDRVFFDLDNDGIFEPGAGEFGMDGVKVNLYLDNGNGVIGAGDTLLNSVTTSGGGGYTFAGLAAGNYIVTLDPINFQPGNVLEDLESSTGNDIAGSAPDPDNDVDHDDNGTTAPGFGIASKAFTLSAGGEPAAGVDGDGTDSNRTVDFGVKRLESPTGVQLAGFQGERKDGDAVLSWQTLMETGVAGFDLYRASEPGGSWTKVNGSGLIAARDSQGGAKYDFRDPAAPRGAVWYRLVLVTEEGRRYAYGPLYVGPSLGRDGARLFLPALGR